VVAEIGDSVLPIGATFCIVRFETTQKNMQCNANKLKEKVGISRSNNYLIADIIGHILILKTETKNMTGGAVFYQNKLVGVIAYKDKAIEIAKLW
jgi:hypothetical protein